MVVVRFLPMVCTGLSPLSGSPGSLRSHAGDCTDDESFPIDPPPLEVFVITKKYMQFILSYPHTKEELKTQQTDRTRTSKTISYLKR